MSSAREKLLEAIAAQEEARRDLREEMRGKTEELVESFLVELKKVLDPDEARAFRAKFFFNVDHIDITDDTIGGTVAPRPATPATPAFEMELPATEPVAALNSVERPENFIGFRFWEYKAPRPTKHGISTEWIKNLHDRLGVSFVVRDFSCQDELAEATVVVSWRTER